MKKYRSVEINLPNMYNKIPKYASQTKINQIGRKSTQEYPIFSQITTLKSEQNIVNKYLQSFVEKLKVTKISQLSD